MFEITGLFSKIRLASLHHSFVYYTRTLLKPSHLENGPVISTAVEWVAAVVDITVGQFVIRFYLRCQSPRDKMVEAMMLDLNSDILQ